MNVKAAPFFVAREVLARFAHEPGRQVKEFIPSNLGSVPDKMCHYIMVGSVDSGGQLRAIVRR